MAGSKIDQIADLVSQLVEEAQSVQDELKSKESDYAVLLDARPQLSNIYHNWYARALRLVSQTIPEQREPFIALYQQPRVQSWLVVGHVDTYEGFKLAYASQVGIIASIPNMVAIRALDLTGLVSADLLDSELGAAQALLDEGFVRAAGAVAGVVAEGHLKYLHNRSGLTFGPKDGIYVLADRLKTNSLIPQADERQFQAVADIRNNCDHKNPTDPTQDEVQRMITLVNELIKRVQIP